MGIKELIAQKKLAKNSDKLLPLVMDDVYKRIKTLTDAKFDDYQGELKAFTQQTAQSLLAYCQKVEKNLAEQEKQAIKSVKELATTSTFNFDAHIAKIKQENAKSIEEISKQMLSKIDNIIAKIENMRGPKGDKGDSVKGDRGDDGSPDTPEQVVTKVNKVGGVKMAAVEGLPEAIKSVKKGGGGKSGGMGNVQHETKPVSAVTTSVSTTYPVAAGGRAAWVTYQGQFLVYGTHYTISGTTVTLTFDKVDSTFLDITYIRG